MIDETVDFIKRLPPEICVKITLLICDYQTMMVWEKYLLLYFSTKLIISPNRL